jgi:AAA family ATP:ADP antiporter
MPEPSAAVSSKPAVAKPAVGDPGGADPAAAEERRTTITAAVAFFLLMAGYYVLRPVREEMGIEGGVEDLQWLYTGTFVSVLAAVPLLSWIVARLRRRAAVPVIYALFVGNLVVFQALLPRLDAEATVVLARVIYVWVSVFNMFVVSLFWALMADLFSVAGSKRRFGLVSAGGSAGAIVGPLLTASLAERLGPGPLLLVAACLLTAATIAIARVGRRASGASVAAPGRDDGVLGGSLWEGFVLVLRSPQLLGISGYIVLYSAVSTFLYFEQANIVKEAISDGGARTRLFAQMDLATNVLALALQALATAGLVRRFGVGFMLLAVPVIGVLCFGALAIAPVLAVLVVVQVIKRAAGFAVARPAREILFTGVTPAERYKGKLVIDTVVYRGGDMLSAWAFAGLTGLGLGLSAIAALGIPVTVAWGAMARFLGRRATVAKDEAR